MATLSPLDGIELDPGDMGVIFVPGLGFRPADGVEQYGVGKGEDCPMVFHSNEPGGQWETIVHHCEAPTEKWTPLFDIPDGPSYWAVPLPTPTYISTTPTPIVPWDTPIVPWTPCCGPTPWIPPEVPEVPLPATAVLAVTGMLLLILLRSIQTLRLAAAIKRI